MERGDWTREGEARPAGAVFMGRSARVGTGPCTGRADGEGVRRGWPRHLLLWFADFPVSTGADPHSQSRPGIKWILCFLKGRQGLAGGRYQPGLWPLGEALEGCVAGQGGRSPPQMGFGGFSMDFCHRELLS